MKKLMVILLIAVGCSETPDTKSQAYWDDLKPDAPIPGLTKERAAEIVEGIKSGKAGKRCCDDCLEYFSKVANE